jgi:hypothetical protein
MADVLSVILSRANSAGHISGVLPHLIPGGITHLQYDDDTLIMIQDDDTQIANLKFLLMCFEDMSGLKTNYLKSEVLVMGSSRARQQRVADWLNCKRGSFPFIYLGLPISDRMLSMEQWLFLVRKMAGRIESWRGKFMSSGGRLILSNPVWLAYPLCYGTVSSLGRHSFMLSLTLTGPDSTGRERGLKGSTIWLTCQRFADLRIAVVCGSSTPRK